MTLTLESLDLRVTELSDDLMVFSVRIDAAEAASVAAQNTAYTAQDWANDAIADVYQTGLDANIYTDAQIQALRDELTGNISTSSGNLQSYVVTQVEEKVAAQIAAAVAAAEAAAAAAEQVASDLGLEVADVQSAANQILNTELPAQATEIDNLALQALTTQGDLDTLLTDFEFSSFQQAVDATVVSAGESATAASLSATAAAAAEDGALQHASAAQSAQTSAETAQAAAETSASNASTSEQTAATSAATATSEAALASQSETNATNSATASATSASTATTKATEASQSAAAAEVSKLAAETAQGSAQTAATSAATSETNAAGSASAASTSAATVVSARNAAEGYELSAASASTTATNASTAAGVSAASAEESRLLTASLASTVDGRVTDVEATVGTHAATLVDLAGNAAAGYLIKAQAGGAVSLLQLVAADGSTGSVSVAKLEADDILLGNSVDSVHIKGGAITAAKLTTGEVITQKSQMGAAVIGRASIETAAVGTLELGQGSVTNYKFKKDVGLSIGINRSQGWTLAGFVVMPRTSGFECIFTVAINTLQFVHSTFRRINLEVKCERDGFNFSETFSGQTASQGNDGRMLYSHNVHSFIIADSNVAISGNTTYEFYVRASQSFPTPYNSDTGNGDQTWDIRSFQAQAIEYKR